MRIIGRIKTRFRPRLRTVLLVVNLTVVVLPLGGIFFFRIYEDQLVQQTESELISQAAFIGAAYRQGIVTRLADHRNYGIALAQRGDLVAEGYYRPIAPQIDFAINKQLPPRPDGTTPEMPADETARAVGESLSFLLADAQRTTLAGVRLLDFNGIVVAGGNEIGLSFASVDEVARARSGRYASAIRKRISDSPPPSLASISRGTGIRVFVAMPIIQEGRLWGVAYLSRTPRNIFKHLYSERGKVVMAGITILAITVFLVYLTSATISGPIHRLIARTRQISGGKLAAMRPLENPGTREMELLSQSFADMARSLHQRSQYIRDFATHVSHEFKTPLTSIQGAAELLQEHFEDMSGEERTRFLKNVVADSERLKHLVTGLLELARADNVEQTADKIDVDEALRNAVAGFDDQEMVDIHGRAGNAEIGMSNENFDMIFSNLLENARQHGAARVRINVARRGDLVEIVVADDGPGIPAHNRAKIFTPFFTTRRPQGGTGLGLGIVKSILDAHHGGISLDEGGTGATFRITLPVTGSANEDGASRDNR